MTLLANFDTAMSALGTLKTNAEGALDPTAPGDEQQVTAQVAHAANEAIAALNGGPGQGATTKNQTKRKLTALSL